MAVVLDPALLSRIQFALTLSFHILFPALNIGLALYLLIWEAAWLKTRKQVYYQLCQFWTKLFALAFGMGVVSGIVLSYEFGTNFSKFSEVTGNILGPLMSYEVLTAFFLEAGFLGVMLFGWKRVSTGVHFFSTLMVTIGTLISAFWILAANSWMHTPSGYRLENGIFYVVNWWQVIFNPSFSYRLMHMVVASFISSTLLIGGIAAWYLLKQRYQSMAKTIFSLTLLGLLFLAPLQLFLGDLHGLNTLKYQPIKIAAMEGRWETMRGAPLTLFAIPDMENEVDLYALDIPYLASVILTHHWEGEVLGLKSVPPQDRPNVPIVFYSFRIMVTLGFLFIAIALIGLFLRFRRRLYDTTWFLRLNLYAAPLGFVAVITGWFTTEVGRQPWIVYGLMRTQDGVSALPASSILMSLIVFVILYATLLIVFIYYLLHIVRKGPQMPEIPREPTRLTAWLEEEKLQ